MSIPGFAKFVLAPAASGSSGTSDSSGASDGVERIDASAIPPRVAVRVDWRANHCESSCYGCCDGNTIIDLIAAAAGKTPSEVIVTIPEPGTFRLTLPASKLPEELLSEWQDDAGYGRIAHALYVPVEHASAFAAANPALTLA